MAKDKTTTEFLARICVNNRITIPYLEAASDTVASLEAENLKP